MKLYLFPYIFIIREFENIKYYIERFFYFKKHISLLNYILYKFGNDNKVPIKGKYFQKFLDKSKTLNLQFKNEKFDKFLLVENFINHPLYTYTNILSAKFLNEFHQYKILGVLRQGDIKAELLFKAFGVKNFYILKKQNLISRIIYIIKALNLIKNVENINEFCKIKFNNTEIGYSTYDTYIRYTGDPSIQKVNPKLISILSVCMYDCDKLKQKLFFKKNIKISVQSETVFNPLNTFFQLSLLNKINVFSRCGIDEISLRQYTNWRQRHTYKYATSQKIFDAIINHNKKKILKWFNMFKKDSFKNKNFGIDTRILKYYKQDKKILNKKQLNNYFGWKNKKIVVFFFNHFIDRNYHNGPRMNFQDSYSWAKYALDKITKDTSVNWILKPHPTEKFFNSKKNFDEYIGYLVKNHENIRLFPDTLNNLSLIKSADLAITSNGSVGMEYPAFGINCVYTEKSTYSNLKFTNPLNNKSKINLLFKNIIKHKSRPSKEYSLKSKCYMYIQQKALLSKCSLLPKDDISRSIDEENFWKQSINLQKNYIIKDDLFLQMLAIQLKYKMRHTINIKNYKLKIILKYFNDYNDKL